MGGRAIVVLARPHDPAVNVLAGRRPEDVCVITPWDLSTPGWSYRSREPGASVAMSGGRRLPAEEIDGVITRLPCVFEEDLGHMEPVDRAYAASEMNAFLLAWLCGLKCPVVNRPTPTALWGPSWRHEKWVRTADLLGIPVQAARRRVECLGHEDGADASGEGAVTVTVVGRRHAGHASDALVRHAMRLARAAGVQMLSVRFGGSDDGSRFLGASIWPEVVTADLADLLMEHLGG